jgi:DNA-directed RNA polymerase specialized sigma24 family protein
VSLFTPGRITEPLNGNEVDGEQDAVELQVQRVLKEIETLSSEAQLALYQRLLGGLASKLTAAITSKSVTAAQTLEATGAKVPARRGTGTRSAREGFRVQSQCCDN